MPLLHIIQIQDTILTDNGKFGCVIKFGDGLNVIRADNTSGKSSYLNSLLYALGLEVLLGREGRDALYPSLREELEFNNRIYKVLESYVELDIRNAKDEVVRIKRQIVGTQDDRLVMVSHLSSDSNQSNRLSNYDYYFLRDSGAAQRERGFHTFLAAFLGLELPQVETFNDTKVPLYLECIFPLLFIEQKKGWSEIQATIPKKYRIRNAAKVAVEYVLSLDVAETQKEKRRIELDKALISSKWSSAHARLKGYAELLGGILSSFPSTPQALIELSQGPNISMPFDDKWIPLNDWIVEMRATIINLRGVIESSSEVTNKPNDYGNELESLERELFYLERDLAGARNDYYQEDSNIKLLHERLASLGTELLRNQDAIRLQKYGANINSLVVHGTCPTCRQELTDSLLDQSALHVPVMPVEDNIKLIQQQIQATKAILSQSLFDLDKKRQIFKNKQDGVNAHRKKVQDLKTNLVQDSRLPNLALIREMVSREEKLNTAEEIKTELNNIFRDLSVIVEEWKAVRSREASLPEEYFSALDNKKLARLEDYFRVNLINFGFSSNNPQAIELSRDTYRPRLKGHDLQYGSSASDNIRLIWAYSLALQNVGDDFETNHLKLCVFDEPGQQQVDIQSKRKFYQRMGKADPSRNQFIVNSSDDQELLDRLLSNVRHHRFEFGNKVFTPLENL
jgi:hypothetical protein